MGDILAGVVNNGANSVSLQFTIDDPTSAQDIARAVESKKAEALASRRIFCRQIAHITENGNYPRPMYATH